MTRTITAMAVATMMAGMAASGCTSSKQDAPEASGPSGLGTSIAMYASPDILRQDGVSQSLVTVQAIDPNGQALRNLPIRLEVWVGNSVVDFGALSGKNLVTGSDGRATAVYTAPPAPAQAVDTMTVVRIVATPVGTDYGNATERAVSIRLVPVGVVLPINGAPTASFVSAPSAPLSQSPVSFDASSSFDLDGTIVSYVWRFGDGSTGSGAVVQHQYSAGGIYVVSLTVTDDRGLTNTATQNVTVSDGGLPTASFDYSPSTAIVNQKVYFNAAKSSAVTGRTIARYDWDYGNGRQDSGVLTWEIFTAAGNYNVTLTVTDDAGKKSSTSKEITVSGADLRAGFSYSPANPTRGDTVSFNAADSTSTFPITSYAWDFGDGATATGATATHVFSCTGTVSSLDFSVRLTITDSQTRTATTTKSVTVKLCGQ